MNDGKGMSAPSPTKTAPLTWLGGYEGAMHDDWTLHLLHKNVDQALCGLYRPRRVTKREANSPKWCETCFQAATEGLEEAS